jgi:hypothetical protein
MNTIPSPKPSTTHQLQKGQNFVEFAFILVVLAVITMLLLKVSGASNSDLVARINCTIQAHQWVDISTTSASVPSPIYGCLKAGVSDATYYSSRYLGSRTSYLPGLIFDTHTRKRIG